MARINKAKNFLGKSYVVSNEIEALIQTLSFDSKNSTLGFGEGKFGDDTTSSKSISFAEWIAEAKTAAKTDAITAVTGDALVAGKIVLGKDASSVETSAFVPGTNVLTDSATTLATDAAVLAAISKVSADAIGVEAGDGINISIKEGTTTNVISTDIKLAKVSNEGAGVYQLQIKEAGKETYKSVGEINLPADMVATSGELVDADAEGNAGTFIKMTIANADPFYIDVKDLIEYNSYEASVTITPSLVEGKAHTYAFDVNDKSIVTAKIADAAVTETQLNESVNASLDKADSAIQAGDVARITYEDSNVKAALDDIYVQIGDGGSVANQIKDAIDALDGDATIATVDGGVVTIKGGIVEVDGVVDNSEASDIVLAKVATTGDAVDVKIADAGNLIVAENVEGALAEIAAQIDAMDADLVAETGKTPEQDGVFVVNGVKQVDGKITEIASVEVEKAGAAAAVKNLIVNNIESKVVQIKEDILVMEQQDEQTAASNTIDGRVLAVYDAADNQIFPEITYKNGISTIMVDFGEAATENFTVLHTVKITVA